MNDARLRFVPFPPVGKLGVIGDRRTAAMVAADGTVCWWCLPNYDGDAAFGALLDVGKGGFWRLGPQALSLGEQRYIPDTAVLVTRWEQDGFTLELTDTMLWPDNSRPAGFDDRRTILRRLRSLRGRAPCVMRLEVKPDFGAPAAVTSVDGGFVFTAAALRLGLWASRPLETAENGLAAEFCLSEGDEVWFVLGVEEAPAEWTGQRADEAFASTTAYWRNWNCELASTGSRDEMIHRSALTVQLLSFAPTGAPLAAPTSSLPERIGGGRNYDYRYSWVRDASLSVALLSLLGQKKEARRFFDWLEHLQPGKNMPLQVVYCVDGGREMPLTERKELTGYRESTPVHMGNAAADMVEIDSFGYLADSALIFLEHGGSWRDGFWDLIRRVADFTVEHWREPGACIWELTPVKQFVVGKVMSWVTLDRAVRIAERIGWAAGTDIWRKGMAEIRAEVMGRGWSERLGSFRQYYDVDTVDAALLLIPVMGFLPADHPRVIGTVAQIETRLMVNGFVYRFVASELPNQGDRPLGEEEGGFLMCTFWLAHVYALRGEREKADAILRRAEALAGGTGLFSEAVDARTPTLIGNMPLVFSHAEYARAALALG